MFTRMKTQKRLNMNIGNYTKTLCDDLRKGLLITLTLLFVCPGVWGQSSEPVTWTAVSDRAGLQQVFTDGGNAILTNNIDVGWYCCTVATGKTVVLNLNGYSISTSEQNHDQQDVGQLISISQNSKLTILDDSNDKLGKITRAHTSHGGGGIYNEGEFVFQSGTITENVGGYGGGVYNKGTMTMTGGAITNNIGYDYGGAIYNAAGATLTISGGTITGNNNRNIHYCTGIYNLGNLKISGNPVIMNNNLSHGITLANNNKIAIEGSLTGEKNTICIAMATPGTFTTGGTSETDYSPFFSLNSDYEVFKQGDYQAALRTCWAGLNELLTRGGIDDENSVGNGIVKLQRDYKGYASDDCLTIPVFEPARTITLDLNGHTLDRHTGNKAEGCVIKNLGSLIIKDTSEGQTGTIKGGSNTNGGGGIHNEGTLTINAGTIKENYSSHRGGGIYNSGKITITGGTISNNRTTQSGAGIYNSSDAVISSGKGLFFNGGSIESNTNSGDHGGGIYNMGDVTISSGNITQNVVSASSKSGGGIYNAGTLYIQGGNITANTATQNGAGIYNDGEFHLQGAPAISTNTVGSNARNVYLTTDHPTITIDGDLTNSTLIGINMQTFGVFTSGLNNYQGTYERFTSEASNIVKLTENASHEAELVTYWTYLKRMMEVGGEITLELNKTYQASIGEEYLHVPSDKTVTLHLNGATIDRHLTTAKASGCAIYNQGTLTISGSGTIKGGYNDDSGIKGGGICNTGTLTIQSGTISNNKATSSGGGIYNEGTLTIEGGTIQNNQSVNSGGGGICHNGTTFNLQGGPIIKSNTTNGVTSNVYLTASKEITITGNLTDNTNKIGVSIQDSRLVFTSGLSGKGDSNNFTADVSTNGIGLNSSGEAIVGPAYNIVKPISNGTITVVKNNSAQKAVEGEAIRFYYNASSGYVPVSLTVTPSSTAVSDSYPKDGVEYNFTMPGEPVTIAIVCQPGGYCGDDTSPNQLQDVKYYLNGTTLTFVTKDDNNYQMKSYTGLSYVPWYASSLIQNNYTSVSLSSHVTTISPYAFQNSLITSADIPSGVTTIGDYAFHQCSDMEHVTIPATVSSIGEFVFVYCGKLQDITVVDGNANYMNNSADGALYTKVGSNPGKLIQYPAGKTSSAYTLPASVTEIDKYAFVYEKKLQSISVAGGSTAFKHEDGVLYSYDGTVLYHYPSQKATPLRYSIAADVTEIKPYAVDYNQSLEAIYILSEPTGSSLIGGVNMFANCSAKKLVKKDYRNYFDHTYPWNQYGYYNITLENASISLTPNPGDNPAYYDYTGSVIKPTDVSVVSGAGDGLTLRKDIDYTVSYDEIAVDDYTSVGEHDVIITGIGYYAGINLNTTYTITRKVDFVTGTGHYGTYYNADPVDLQKPEVSGDYTYVYMITQIDWTSDPVVIHLNEVNYFPHGVPCLLYLTNSTLSARTFHLVKREDSALSISSSPDFMGVTGNTTIETLLVGKNAVYALKNDKFVRATEGSLPANRCYIARPSGLAGAPAYISIGSDDTTGITMEEENGKIENLFSPDWYTIDGVKLNGMPTKKGIYLNNGRKVIIK